MHLLSVSLCCADFSNDGSTEHELGKDLGAAMITASFDSEILTEEIFRAIDPIPLDDIPMLNNNVEITDTFTEDNLRFGNMQLLRSPGQFGCDFNVTHETCFKSFHFDEEFKNAKYQYLFVNKLSSETQIELRVSLNEFEWIDEQFCCTCGDKAGFFYYISVIKYVKEKL